MEATVYPGTYARSTPDKPAIIVPALDDAPEITVTYAELDERSLRLAWVLREAGLDKGDHIAYLSDNRPEVFEVYWAALRSGMYITGINHHLSSEEAAYIVNDCGARALVVSAGTADLATAVVEHAPGVEIRLAFGGPVDGYDGYAARWPRCPRSHWGTSRVERTCSTPRARPAAPRASSRRCPTGRSTSPAT
jgi:fatty-acyl-CoA synthase